MQRLLKSKQPIFCIRFRDYVRATYHEELILTQEVDEYNTPLTVLYLATNSIHLKQIEQALSLFLADPNHQRYHQASWQSGDYTQNTNIHSIWDENHHSTFNIQSLLQGKFTLFITVLCIIVYLLQLSGWHSQITEIFHYPANIDENTQFWRYLSHTLVHLSPLHILFNLTWWWIFANKIEYKFGYRKLILLTILSGLVTGIAQNIASGPAFFGLSGVVYAVLSFVFSVDQFSSYKQFNLPKGFFNMLLIGICLGVVSPFIGIEMGNTAHISGLIIGLLFGFFQAKSIR